MSLSGTILCYVRVQENDELNRHEYLMSDAFVEIALDEVMNQVYNKNIYCPLPHLVTLLQKQFDMGIIGQNDPVKWKADFKQWKSQDMHILRDKLSKVESYVPMYNIHTPSLKISYRVEIVRASDLVHSIIKRHCRIVNTHIKQALDASYESLLRGTNERQHVKRYKDLLNHFNIKTLHETFKRVIARITCSKSQRDKLNDRTNYEKSTSLSLNSSPFFTITELRCMAHNLAIADTTDLKSLYQQIRTSYIDNSLIIKHVQYISEKNYVGLIDYYTFQGDKIFNTYLRTSGQPDNNIVRKWIHRMINVIHMAPREHNTEIVLWRFLKNDKHIEQNTKRNIYKCDSFMSCTRDPLHISKCGGNIVIRIHIKDPKHAALLCIETFSRFPMEHEVLLPPGSEFRIIGKNNFLFQHVHNQTTITQTYDLELIPQQHKFVYPSKQPITDSNIPLLDLTKIDLSARHQRDHRINHFNCTYTDKNHYFAIELDYIRFVFYWQRYQATTTVSGDIMINKYWYTNGGYSWVLMDQTDATVLLLLEIGHDEIHVNYNLTQHSLTDQLPISETTLINFLTTIGKLFDMKRVVIHSRYRSCRGFQKVNPDKEHEYWFSRYNHDLYRYLLDRHRRFNFAPNITMRIFETDFLRQLSVPKSLRKRTCYQKLKANGQRVSLRDLLLLVYKTLCHHVGYYKNEIQRYICSELKIKRAVLDVRYYLEID